MHMGGALIPASYLEAPVSGQCQAETTSMEITLVKVFPVQEEKLKAFVSVVFDNCFMVNDIKVIQGKDGLFLSMPSRRKKSGEFKDVAHPLNNATRRLFEERVLAEYRQVVEDATPRRPDRVAEASAPKSAAVVAAAPIPARGREEEESGEVRMPPASSSPASQPSAPAMMAADGDGVPGNGEKTLEEVQEIHLSDSFWSVS